MINIQITKTGNESSANLLRRFQKKIKTSKIVIKAKSKRYHERQLSDLKIKEAALGTMKKREETQKLIKLGKITPRFNHQQR